MMSLPIVSVISIGVECGLAEDRHCLFSRGEVGDRGLQNLEDFTVTWSQGS